MSFETPISNLQRINFDIEGKAAKLEFVGNQVIVYINHKKITLTVDPDWHSVYAIENYLNQNKEKIKNLLNQHQLIEDAYKGKSVRLMGSGRFEYLTNRGEYKETSLEKEREILRKKVRQQGEKSKWAEKLAKIEKAIGEINVKKPTRQRPEKNHSFHKPTANQIEATPKFSERPISKTDLHISKQYPVTEIKEKHRRAVRNKTKKKVKEEVFIGTGSPKKSFSPRKIFEEVKLYKSLAHDTKQFLGPLDVLQVPVKIDFDETWVPLFYNKDNGSRWVPEGETKVVKVKTEKGTSTEKLVKGKKLAYQKPSRKEYQTPQQTFYCHYTEGLKIKSKDSFFDEGRLDEEKFLEAATFSFYQTLQAQKASGATHILWDATAIENSLKNLSKGDPSYRDKEKLNALRYKLANAFKNQFERKDFKNLTLHLCLSKGKGEVQNYNALVSAFSSLSNHASDRIMVYRNTDMPVLAQELAEKAGKGKVSMVQLVKGKSLGGDWLKHPDLDNLHCRSSSAATVACLLDKGIGPQSNTRDMVKRIEKLGGTVVEL